MDHRAALFLDFDNVFTALIERDVAAAAAFVQDPLRWIGWLESLGGEDRQRRILVRRCYLNPIAKVLVPGEDRPRYFSSFRNAFVRAGFQMVDCPPLTLGGKTSADMVMVMDILDTLAHPTGFEDFIILSSDADFTPVLLRLRAHDRRGIVIATGSAADAYRAAAETVVRYDEFAGGALGLARVLERGPDRTALRGAILAEVRALVAAATEPLAQAWVAQQVVKRLGRDVVDSDWAGAGGFRALLEQAALPGLALDRTPPGWLLDPARHHPPAAEAPATPDPRLVRMAGLVRRLLGVLGNIPMLGPDRLDFMLMQLGARLPIADPTLQEIRNGISEAARAEGLDISPGAVNAVMHRVGLAGFDWQAPPNGATPRLLRKALLDNIRQHMQQQRLELGDEEAALLTEWVGLAVTEPAPPAATEPAPPAATDTAPPAATEPASPAATEPAPPAATEPASPAATDTAPRAATGFAPPELMPGEEPEDVSEDVSQQVSLAASHPDQPWTAPAGN
jgi:hypothetical protein